MKTKIETKEDLQVERANLKNQIELSKLNMRREVNAIKSELNPARQAVGMFKDIFTAPRKGLLNVGVGIGVDLILRRGILARAGWLPKLILPFVVRRVTTNIIQKNQTSIIEKGLLWVKKVTEKRPAKARS